MYSLPHFKEQDDDRILAFMRKTLLRWSLQQAQTEAGNHAGAITDQDH